MSEIDKKELNILISTDTKIVSINSLYSVKVAWIAGHPRPQMYKSANAQKFAREVTDQLRALKLGPDYVDWFRNTRAFTMSVNFVLKAGIKRRDVSNMDKLLIDTITKYIHDDLGVENFDDSLFSSVQFFKSELPHSKKEYCIVQIKESTDNLRFDAVPIPETLWFWNKDKKPELKPIPKRKRKDTRYFSETETRDGANTIIYLLDSDQLNPETYTDIIQDLDQTVLGSTGFLYLGLLGTWEGEKKDWIEELKLRFSGSSCRRVKVEYIENPNDILKVLEVW